MSKSNLRKYIPRAPKNVELNTNVLNTYFDKGNEVSEASKMSNLTGGKTETNLPNQLEVIFCQDLNGSLDGVGSADVCDYTCHNDGRFWRCYNFVQETKMGSLVCI
ncbi:hypothetical protein KY289_018236 [Solanum tuberosum]|nr:hypothetical protein KY284_018071 [Solanum tuberosum]KAH0690878.1 hypothetical protein KY289_018236 [Solanum tuberosum]